jgi:hypothetical protein
LKQVILTFSKFNIFFNLLFKLDFNFKSI